MGACEDPSSTPDMLNRPTGRPDRRTFAIISHPMRARLRLPRSCCCSEERSTLPAKSRRGGKNRRAWLRLDEDRAAARHLRTKASVMTFEHEGVTFNLLETPGPTRLFGRTRTGPSPRSTAAVMVIDAARASRPQTRKLFEVCRSGTCRSSRSSNKVDREGKEPFELPRRDLPTSVRSTSAPMYWPGGWAGRSMGIYDLSRTGSTLDKGRRRPFSRASGSAVHRARDPSSPR
jgi:peptide chain release factor 3